MNFVLPRPLIMMILPALVIMMAIMMMSMMIMMMLKQVERTCELCPANVANNDCKDADNDDGDIDGDNEDQVETLVAHLWNLSARSTLPLARPGSPHEHQLRTQCFRFRHQV